MSVFEDLWVEQMERQDRLADCPEKADITSKLYIKHKRLLKDNRICNGEALKAALDEFESTYFLEAGEQAAAEYEEIMVAQELLK